MKRKTGHATATKSDHGIWVMVALFLAYVAGSVAMAPAILANLNAPGALSLEYRVGGVASVIFSAVFFEAARAKWAERERVEAFVFAFVASILLAYNGMNAFANAVTSGDHKRDDRRAIVADAQKSSSQRRTWSQDRAKVAEVAGATPPEAYEAQVQQLISQNSRRWQATEECNPLKIPAGASREFCSEVADLRAKKSAAEKRDELDAKIAKLDAKSEDRPVVTSVDPYADRLAEFLGLFGYTFTDDQVHLLGRSREWLTPIAYEMMAAGGPSGAAAFVSFLLGYRRRAVTVPPPAVPKSTEPPRVIIETPAVQAAAVASGDPIHAFVADCLESCPGAVMRADEPWQMWIAWCGRKGLPTGSQRGFGLQLKRHFAHDRNNGRPRYLNVRAKAPAGHLRLAVSN